MASLIIKDLAGRGCRIAAGPHKGIKIDSITVRETTGTDEAVARATAEARGKDGSMAVELTALSIVEVNGARVEQPYLDFEHWNTKARNVAVSAWRKLSALDDREEAELFSKAELSEG